MSGGVEIKWNGVSSNTIPGLVFTNPTRQLLGGHRGSFMTIPGRVGSWYFPELRDRRSIKVSGFIIRDTGDFDDRRHTITALADWLDLDIQARLILGDDPTVYYEAVLGDCGDSDEWRDLGTFELEWLVNPFSLALLTTTIPLSATATYVTTFDPDILTPIQPVIEITPTNGTITSLDVGANGETLSWSGTINSGFSLTVDSKSAVVTSGLNTDTELVGAYDPSKVNMAGVFGQFPYLVPGVNTFNFHINTGTATAVSISIKYRKSYRK